MKPKYSVEQILEAVEASHLPLVVKGVDGDNIEIELLHQVETVVVVSNAVLDQVVLSSLKTALHILFDK